MDDVVKGGWDEESHPRDERGRFGTAALADSVQGAVRDAFDSASLLQEPGSSPRNAAAHESYAKVQESLYRASAAADKASMAAEAGNDEEAHAAAKDATAALGQAAGHSNVYRNENRTTQNEVAHGQILAHLDNATTALGTFENARDFGTGMAKADWNEELHPRGEGGRFAAAELSNAVDAVASSIKNSGFPEDSNSMKNAQESLRAARMYANAAVMEEADGNRDTVRSNHLLATAKDHLAQAIGSARDMDGHSQRVAAIDELNGGPIAGRPVVFDENGVAKETKMKKSKKKTSVAKASKAVKHKAKAVPVDVEDLISPVLKELEGRVAVLESSTPSEVLAHREPVLDAGVADEMSLRKQADMAASAVTKEELLEQARIAALEEFTKMTNPS